MAFSKSVTHAQIPKACDLCDTDTNIKWKCIQCGHVMCEKCKNIHLRVQMSEQHDIVDIKSFVPQEFSPSDTINTSNISCDKHPSKMSCLFCRTCDQLICPDCVASVHKKHDFDPINEVVHEKLEHLNDIEARNCSNLTICRLKIKEIKATEMKCDSMIDEEISKVKRKEQELKDEISKSSQELQNRLETERKVAKEMLTNQETQAKDSEKDLIDKQSQILGALTSNQGRQIFTMASKFKEPLAELKFNFKSFEISKLILPEKSFDAMELFGSFQKTTIPRTLPGIDFKMIKSYTTDFTYISKLITLDEQTAWISDWKKGIFHKETIEDNKTRTIKEMSKKIYGMAITQNNDILLSVVNSSDIKLLTKSGEIKPFLSVPPLLPCGIHVTSDNVTIVGVKDRGGPYIITDKSTRALYIYGKNGKQQKCYEYDRSNNRLFTFPHRIKTNTNNDIVVIDRTSDYTGRVVVVGREGGLKWTYNGHPNINKSEEFNPSDIVTTSLGHIIVSDYWTRAFHVLSEAGDILSCQVMKDIGISYPLSLDIDRRGQLWVGCDTGGKDTGAKIHIVTLQ